MLRLSYQSMVIDAPVNRTFSYAADVYRLEWLFGTAALWLDTESTGKGPAFEVKRRVLVEGGTKTVMKTQRCEVAEIVPNERLAWDELLPFMRHRFSLKLQASSGSTLVTIGEEYLPTNPIGWLMFMPLILIVYPIVLLLWPLTRWHGRLPLRRLKARVEGKLG